MIYTTTFPLQKPLIKHSVCVASCKGTGGRKPANGILVYTKNKVKNESIRASNSAGVNCWQKRFICSANKLYFLRATWEWMKPLIIGCSRLSGNREALWRIALSSLLKHWAIQKSDGLVAINLSYKSHLAKFRSTVCFRHGYFNYDVAWILFRVVKRFKCEMFLYLPCFIICYFGSNVASNLNDIVGFLFKVLQSWVGFWTSFTASLSSVLGHGS